MQISEAIIPRKTFSIILGWGSLFFDRAGQESLHFRALALVLLTIHRRATMWHTYHKADKMAIIIVTIVISDIGFEMILSMADMAPHETRRPKLTKGKDVTKIETKMIFINIFVQ